jgi:hypothetical protein
MESSRYALHLKAWRQTLGEDQVLTAVYDDLKTNAQEFIDRITNFVGAERIPLGPRHIRFVLTSETMTQPRNYYWTRGAAKLSEWSRARRLGTMVAAAKRLGVHKLFLGGGITFPEMSREEIGELYRLFRPEIEELEGILKRDLSGWKAPREKAEGGSYAA